MPEIHLDTDEVELLIGGEALRQPCEIVLKTGRGPRVSFMVSGLDVVTMIRAAYGNETRFALHLVKAGVRCDAFFAGSNGGVVEFSPFMEPVLVGGSVDQASLRFDLINFPSFMVLYGASASKERDRLDVSAGGWCIEICPARQSSDVDAFQSAFYSVSHSCTMRRLDGAAFSSDEAQEVLNVLHDALSFAAGRWVTPAFVVGFGSEGEALWKWWGTSRLHPDLSSEGTWFDTHHADALAGVVSGLLDLRKSAERAAAFRAALYWYVRSGTGAAGVDGGLILLQAALERLSWQRIVIDGGSFTRENFDKLRTGDRLRLLLNDCGIPLGIPAGLAELTSEANGRNWDGPWALADCRNLLVHPGTLQPLPWHELWKLARWYVELVLLRMLGFAGEYSNRTLARRFVGAVERVPWG